MGETEIRGEGRGGGQDNITKEQKGIRGERIGAGC